MNHDAKNASVEGKPVTPVNSCRGEWSTPKNCDVTRGQCEYHIQWSYSTRTDYIAFTISTTHADLWTGVGFSDDHKMVIRRNKNQREAKRGIADGRFLFSCAYYCYLHKKKACIASSKAPSFKRRETSNHRVLFVLKLCLNFGKMNFRGIRVFLKVILIFVIHVQQQQSFSFPIFSKLYILKI